MEKSDLYENTGIAETDIAGLSGKSGMYYLYSRM